MITGLSSTLTAAIDSLVRWIKPSVVIDWDTTAVGTKDDVSDLVEQLTVSRSMTTDLPAEANVVRGGASAQADVALTGGQNTQVSTAQGLSGFDGTLFGGQPLGAPFSASAQFLGDAGWESVPVFTGRVRRIQASDDGSATVSALDAAELMRTAITLPVAVALDPVSTLPAPGLNAQWVIRYVLKQNGYHALPPERAQCKMYAALNGSVVADVGTLTTSYAGDSSSKQGASKFVQIPGTSFVGLTSTAPSPLSNWVVQTVWTLGGVVPTHNGANLFIEIAELVPDAIAGSTARTPLINSLFIDNVANNGTYYLGVAWEPGIVVVHITRGGSTQTLNFTAPALTGGVSHYFALHVAFAATIQVNLRVDGTTYTQSVADAGAGAIAFDTIGILQNVNNFSRGPLAGLQVTAEPFSAGMWNDTYVPNALLDLSKNELVAMPVREAVPPWPLLVEIASAEQGVVFVDATGVAKFYNADRFLPAGTSLALVTADKPLKAISSEQQVDTVRNVIRATARTPQIDRLTQWIWEAQEVLMVPARTSLTVFAATEGAIYTVSNTFAAQGASWSTSASGYRASSNSDGTGGDITNLSVTMYRFPNRMILTVSNPNTFDAWLVDNSSTTSPGSPALKVAGRLIRAPENPFTAKATDTDSVNRWGEQPLDVPDNDWVQRNGVVTDIVTRLLARMKDPHPVVPGVELVGDPRWEIGDRITVQDDQRMHVLRDYWIVALNTQISRSDGYSQTATLRDAGPATRGVTGVWTLQIATTGVLDAANGLA